MSPALTETLVSCPDCGQPNFNPRGLKAHQGTNACKKRAAQLQLSKDADAPQPLSLAQTAQLKLEQQHSATRFQFLQAALKNSVGQLKLLKFLAGLEANLLQDLHREMYGETRGGGEAKDVPLLGSWIEEHLQVTETTWRRYLTFFRSITAQHPELARKLIAHWEKWKTAKLKPKAPAKPKALKPGAKPAKPKKAQLTTTGPQMLAGLTLTEDDLKDLVTASDEWNLHELFEQPLKDVTPKGDDPPPPPTGNQFKFWLDDFLKRALKDEYLKLPKDKREALHTTVKEMEAKLSDSLKKPSK